MSSVTPADDARARRRLTNEVKQALRGTALQVALLNHQVGSRLNLRDADFDCLSLIDRSGPMSPGALAKAAGLHPATMTGVLDRLEKAGWVVRDRDPADRRAVVIRRRAERGAEVFALYRDMNGAMDEICADYTPAQLEVILDFLRRTGDAGREATTSLAQ